MSLISKSTTVNIIVLLLIIGLIIGPQINGNTLDNQGKTDSDAFIRLYTDHGSQVVEIENRESASDQTGYNNQQQQQLTFSPLPLPPSFLLSPPRSTALQTVHSNHRIKTRAVKQKFCGEVLVNALALICRGNYRKRSNNVAEDEGKKSI